MARAVAKQRLVTFAAPAVIENQYYGKGTYPVDALVAKFGVANGRCSYADADEGVPTPEPEAKKAGKPTARQGAKPPAAGSQSGATASEGPPALSDEQREKMLALTGPLPAEFPSFAELHAAGITTYQQLFNAGNQLQNIQGVDTAQMALMQSFMVGVVDHNES
jgi:hypothetical protein